MRSNLTKRILPKALKTTKFWIKIKMGTWKLEMHIKV